jgi:hypothetical protein
VNAIAILWTVFITIIFSIPPNELVLWTMLLLAAVMFGWWKVHARRHFHGPTGADEAVLRAAIRSGEITSK